MRLVIVVVVALLAVVGYANRSEPKPVVSATATQSRTPLRVVTPPLIDVHAIDFQTERRPLILAIACGNTPSQCSLQNGVPDWTTPAYGCDWNYATTRRGCVPDQPGDYDCPDLRALGLSDIRVIGDDWMLLDEDGDGFGCEFDPDAEAAFCESLYEPERTTCLDELRTYLVHQERAEESRHDYEHRNDQHGNDEYYDQYEQDPAEFCPRC
jgi:hypothetical protein